MFLLDILRRSNPESPSAPQQHVASSADDAHSRSFVERRSAFAAKRAAIEARASTELAALEQQMADARERLRGDHAAAEADERATSRALALELVADAQSLLAPLIAQWRESPSRPLAVAVGQHLAELIDREARECPAFGNGTSRPLVKLKHILMDALIVEHGPATNMFAHDPSIGVSQLGDVEGAMRVGSPPEFCAALERLESELIRRAAGESAEPLDRCVQRWRIVQTQDLAALADFDREQARIEQARFAATHQQPVGLIRSGGEA
jgi:hypothetical protein